MYISRGQCGATLKLQIHVLFDPVRGLSPGYTLLLCEVTYKQGYSLTLFALVNLSIGNWLKRL